MLRFFCEITQLDEKREVSVAMSGRAKHRIKLPLHVLPNTVAPGTDHHATAHIGGLGQLSRANNLLIPVRKVFVAPRGDCRFGGNFCLMYGPRCRPSRL